VDPDDTMIALSNSSDGVDLYSLTTRAIVKSFALAGITEENNIPLDVAFSRTGCLIAGGHQGRINVWNVGTASLEMLACGGM
jgi:hypothetical protein